MTIEIVNGKMLDTQGNWVPFKNIRIAGNKIAGIDDQDNSFEAKNTINADGCYVIPGLIDLSVSLPEPGFQVKGSIESETKAAAAGGVTTLCCTPATDPVNDSEAVTKLIEKLAKQSLKCDVLPLGALTQGLVGERLSEYASLKNAGCVALSNGFNPIKNLAITKRCFEYAKTHNLSVFLNPIEPSLHMGAIHESYVSTKTGLKGIPSIAETVAVSQLIKLAEVTGTRLHLAQLSAADSVSQVREAKEKGLRISADVAIHNLLYTDDNIESYNSLYHCEPPLRSNTDRLALIEGIKSGDIDAITSAHRPHEEAAKRMPFAQTEPGISGIELLIPMAILLQEKDKLPLNCFIAAMTERAAKVIDQSDTAKITRGNIANICIFDPATNWQLKEGNMLSQGKNSPLIGQNLKGRVITTIYEGSISFSRNSA